MVLALFFIDKLTICGAYGYLPLYNCHFIVQCLHSFKVLKDWDFGEQFIGLSNL